MTCKHCDDTGFLDYRGFSMDACVWCDGKGTIEDSSTVAPLPWLVTKTNSGGWKFLIDKKIKDDPPIYSGFYVSRHGDVNHEASMCSGAGGRYNYHASHFVEELPVRLSEGEIQELVEWALQGCPEGVSGMPEGVFKLTSIVKELLTIEVDEPPLAALEATS